MPCHKTIADAIRDTLSKRAPWSAPESRTRKTHASVLIPIFEDDGSFEILFTERTGRVKHHKGQISFPGGRVDDEDASFEATALRETYEEIGMAMEDVTLLGRVDDAMTVGSNYIVHPYVGIIPHPYAFNLNPGEVERLVRVPFEVFFSEDAFYKRPSVHIEGHLYEGTNWHYQGDIIWGATARMMENFINIISDNLRLLISRE